MKIRLSEVISHILKWTSIILWFLGSQALAQITNCTGNQITLVDKNKKFVQCVPCPPCPPGQEYTIPCHTTAYLDVVRTCIYCPRGKYSRKFDNNPCVDCRRCTNRHVKRMCAPFRNAKCGDCLAGYFYSKVVMGCVECDKCCNDSKDVRPLGCKRVGMCKPRLSGCPTTSGKEWLTKGLNKSKVNPTPKTSPNTSLLKTKRVITPTAALTSVPHHDETTRYTVLEAPSGLPIKNDKPEKEQNSHYNLLIVGIVLFVVVFLILVLVVVVLIRLTRKRSERPRLSSHFSRPVEHQPPRSPNDMLLKDFCEQETDACDELCVMLYKLKGGMYDFDRIATKFQLSAQQRQAIESVRNTPGASPPREFISSLCSGNPEITVKQFAYKGREIRRNSIYQLLEPFFTIQQRN